MNLYVGNIAPTVNAVELQQMFAGVGQILYAKLSEDDKVKAGDCGYAFVYVPNADQARTAIGSLNGKLLKGEKLTVSEMVERPGVVGTTRNK